MVRCLFQTLDKSGRDLSLKNWIKKLNIDPLLDLMQVLAGAQIDVAPWPCQKQKKNTKDREFRPYAVSGQCRKVTERRDKMMWIWNLSKNAGIVKATGFYLAYGTVCYGLLSSLIHCRIKIFSSTLIFLWTDVTAQATAKCPSLSENCRYF